MEITYTKDEVTLIGTPMESFVSEEGLTITISYEDAEELMEQLRVAIALRKDF